jgi:hypothetical protein
VPLQPETIITQLFLHLEKCAPGWRHFKNGCYKYFVETKTWEDALDSCQSMEAKLAVIEDSAENE